MQTQTTTFTKGQRVLTRRSIICGREAEFATIVKRQTDFMDGHWYAVRDEHGTVCEHASMLADATDWRSAEIIRLREDADIAARRENESLAFRWQAEGLREVADRLAA